MPYVEFSTTELLKDSIPNPIPSSKALPTWFKKLQPQITDDPSSSSVKRCIPFLETMTSGFIIPAWCDIRVTCHDGQLTTTFPENFPMPSMISDHQYEQIEGYPLSDITFGKSPLKFHSPWTIKTPKGYSCLFVSPFNHFERRLHIISGIVDTDTYYNRINFPFIWMQSEGDFLIERGEPLIQVIPFKREKYNLKIEETDEKELHRVEAKLATYFRNKYRRLFWHKRK